MRTMSVPLQIQKQLQKETLYGCAVCGCPIVEYAQILSHSDAKTFISENMISLCPFHHLQYKNGENLSEPTLRTAKNNPYNKTHESDSFIVQSQDLPVIVGSGMSVDNAEKILSLCNGCIVGSSLKLDGKWWNPVDPDRVKAFMRIVSGLRAKEGVSVES